MYGRSPLVSDVANIVKDGFNGEIIIIIITVFVSRGILHNNNTPTSGFYT